jgi:hypothetical protein
MKMEHKENIPPEIYDLMQQKPYAALSEKERELVAEWLSPEDYDYLRLVENRIAETLREDQSIPDAALLDTLTDRFRERRRKPASVLQLRVPLWQAAAVAVLMMGAAIMVSRSPEVGVAVLPVRDTVYLAAHLPEEPARRDTVYIPVGSTDRHTAPTYAGSWKRVQSMEVRYAGAGSAGSHPYENTTEPYRGSVRLTAADAVGLPGQMLVLDPRQKDEPLNAVATRNMNEDELLQSFSYVHF